MTTGALIVVLDTYVQAILLTNRVRKRVVFLGPLDTLLTHVRADLPDGVTLFSHVDYARKVEVPGHNTVITLAQRARDVFNTCPGAPKTFSGQ